jgi:hypothetical protein
MSSTKGWVTNSRPNSLSETQWTEELDANVKRGNHKSAEAEPIKVMALLAKDD